MKPAFKINGEEYVFQDITLRTYYKLKTIFAGEDNRDSEFQIVQELTGCPVEQLKKLKYNDWLMVWEEAYFIIQNLSGDASAIRPIVEFNGIKYGLPAVEDLTIGEFADLEVIASSSKSEDKLADIAAVLYRPIVRQKGEKIVLEPYDTEGFEARKELFQDFPLEAIRSANAFFLQYADSSLRSTAESLVKKLEKENLMPQEDLDRLQNLLQQGLGGTQLISLQEEILLTLKEHPSSRYARLSTGLVGRKTKPANKLWPFKHKTNTK